MKKGLLFALIVIVFAIVIVGCCTCAQKTVTVEETVDTTKTSDSTFVVEEKTDSVTVSEIEEILASGKGEVVDVNGIEVVKVEIVEKDSTTTDTIETSESTETDSIEETTTEEVVPETIEVEPTA
jgi:hypothetical protein